MTQYRPATKEPVSAPNLTAMFEATPATPARKTHTVDGVARLLDPEKHYYLHASVDPSAPLALEVSAFKIGRRLAQHLAYLGTGEDLLAVVVEGLTSGKGPRETLTASLTAYRSAVSTTR